MKYLALITRLFLIGFFANSLLSSSLWSKETFSKTDLEDGKRTFSIHCAQCHGIGGAGGGHSRNGPSLTDSITIYGEQIQDIYNVISEGVPRAAMPQWKQRMSADRIEKLARYVFSIKGTQNPKASSKNNNEIILASDTSDGLMEGQKKFRIHCGQCHGLDGTGVAGAGPNLTDQETIHGHSFQDILRVITIGVPEKLMPSWGKKLGPETIRQITGYVHNLHASNKTTPDAPKGNETDLTAKSANLKNMIEAGKRAFNSHCVECHGNAGRGGAGPNLTDEFTLHGGELKDIIRVITNGVAGLMPRWGQKMDEERIAQFAAYVHSIKGTRPTGKRPERRVSRLLNSKYIQSSSATRPDHKSGERTFKIHCEQCHGPAGRGGAGPNLTDEFTLHGEELSDIVRIIADGVPAMQMPTWSQTMSKERIREVAGYVLSLKGTRPTGKLPDSNRPENLRGTSPFR